MTVDRDSSVQDVGRWVSLILRLAMATLFFSAAVSKLKGGTASIAGTVQFFRTTFENTWLPGPMVTLHAYLTPFVEALLVIWLLTGFRLPAAWVVTALFLITLAFGMSVAGKHDVAAHNFNYVLICCAGLYFSRFDRLRVDT